MQRIPRILSIAVAALSLAACGAGQGQPVSPAASAPAATGDATWEQVVAAAKKEGALTVYALNTIPADQVSRFQEVWKKDYPDIQVDLNSGLRPADVTAKVSTEQDAKAYFGDVAQLGGTTSRQLDRIGAVEPFIPPATQDKAVKWNTDPIQDDQHRGTTLAGTLSYVPIWVNSNLVKPADEPKTHEDLTNPKWKDKIVWEPPWSAGYGWNEYYLSKKYYGQDWVTKMQAQNPTFGTDTNANTNQLARGEYAISLGNNGTDLASRLIHAGQPLKAIWPDDFVYGSANGFSVIKNAPHPNAAKVFVNWWFTENGQRFYADLGQFPNRSDVAPKEDWMKGYQHPKEYWWPKASDDALAEPNQKEAASYFKK